MWSLGQYTSRTLLWIQERSHGAIAGKRSLLSNETCFPYRWLLHLHQHTFHLCVPRGICRAALQSALLPAVLCRSIAHISSRLPSAEYAYHNVLMEPASGRHSNWSSNMPEIVFKPFEHTSAAEATSCCGLLKCFGQEDPPIALRI